MKRLATAAFSLLLAACISAQEAQRPPILGIGQVGLWLGGYKTANYPEAFAFYRQLKFDDLGVFQTGAPVHQSYAINAHQSVLLTIGPRLTSSPSSHLDDILFETSDLAAMRAYLAQKGIKVTENYNSGGAKDLQGKSLSGEASFFSMNDPDGHWIGFIQYTTPIPFHPAEGQCSLHLIHAGFVVRDRAAMDKFYKDILGFHVYWHGGMKDDQTNWVDMQVPDGTDWVEFMLIVPADADQRTLGVMNHIALGVPDIHAAYKQLLTNGMKLTEEPKIGRDGKWQLNLYDPDQTRVEIMEFTPVEKPCCSEYTGPHPKP